MTSATDASHTPSPSPAASTPWSATSARWTWASRLLLAGALATIALTYRDYGMTWDEEHSLTNGRYWLEWYESGFTQRGVIDDNNQRLYGSFFNGLDWLLAHHSPLGLYETSHLFTALFGWLALWAAYRLGNHLMEPRAGFFATLALLLTPGWYGHSFNNPKDAPFAVLFVLALYTMLRAYRALPRIPVARTVLVGAVIGLALGIRAGAIVLLGCYAMMFAFWGYARLRSAPGYDPAALGRDAARFAGSWLVAAAVAWLVMLPWWPYVQISPVANMIDALKESARFQFTAVVLYHGGFLPAQELPWHYLPRWFSKTLPDFYFVVLLATSLAAVRARRPAGPTPNRHLHAQLLFLAVAALGLPIAAASGKAVVYDAYRHFLFVIPPLAVLAGCGVSWLAAQPSRAVRIAALAPLAVLALLTAGDMVALHPYQTVYFNRMNGGLPKAYGRYETDYWGASHREGIEWLADNYRTDAPPHSIRVANSAVELFTAYYLQNGGKRMERFVSVAPDAPADLMLSITRWNLHQRRPGQVVHTVERMGVPLLYISELPQTPPAAGQP